MGKDGHSDAVPRIPLLAVNKEQESIISPLDRRSEAYRHAAAETAEKLRREQANAKQPIWTIPNVLTFLRLVFVPVLAIAWDIEWLYSPIACALLFILAAWTDWLDGYLARRLGISTIFGAFLDPVADKIMVTTSLILLSTSPPAPLTANHLVFPVSIIICREITMASLREWAAASGGAAHKAVKVNSLGKWKTACQMFSMSALLVVRQSQPELRHFLPAFMAEPAFLLQTTWVSYYLLWVSAVLALWSLSFYMSNVWTHFVYPNAGKTQ